VYRIARTCRQAPYSLGKTRKGKVIRGRELFKEKFGMGAYNFPLRMAKGEKRRGNCVGGEKKKRKRRSLSLPRLLYRRNRRRVSNRPVKCHDKTINEQEEEGGGWGGCFFNPVHADGASGKPGQGKVKTREGGVEKKDV